MQYNLQDLPVNISDEFTPCEFCGIYDSIVFNYDDFRNLPDAYGNDKFDRSKVRYTYIIHRSRLMKDVQYPNYLRNHFDVDNLVHIRVWRYLRKGTRAVIYPLYFKYKNNEKTDEEILKELRREELRDSEEWKRIANTIN